MSRNYLSRNCELRRGDYLVSNNRKWKAIFQTDGNYSIYRRNPEKPVWASDTYGSDAVRLIMQEDCNLVMYNKDGVPRWHTNSHRGDHMCRLQLTDDGKLVVYQDANKIWTSDMSHGMK